MNKNQNRIILVLLFCGLVAQRVSADDGSLVLNTNTITNQATSNTASTTFPIRADLFTPGMDEKVKDQREQAEQVLKKVEEMSFTQAQVNPLYTADYKKIKTELFQNYSAVNLSDSDENSSSSTPQYILILSIAALPLLIITGFIARRFARRKKRR